MGDFLDAHDATSLGEDDTPGIWFEPKTEALKGVAVSFRENLMLVRHLLSLGPTGFQLGFDSLEAHNNAMLELCGTLSGDSEEYKKMDQALYGKKNLEHFLRITKSRCENLDRAEETVAFRTMGFDAKLNVATEGKDLVRATFYSVVTLAWMTFETTSSDLWIAAVNSCPQKLSKLEGGKNRILGKGKKEKELPQAPAVQDADKYILLSDVYEMTRGTFDLSGKVGDFLQSRFKFSKLDGIRQAYSSAFSEHSSSIDAILKSENLDVLSALRNVIVHQGGIADQEYVKASGRLTLPQIPIGTKLSLSGLELCNVVNPVLAGTEKLLRAVDAWIIAHS